MLLFMHSWQTLLVVSLFLCISVLETTTVVAVLPKGIVSIKRGIDLNLANNDALFGTGSKCNFAGTVVLGGPFSLEQDDKFFTIGSRQLVSYQLMVDYINRFKCGIEIGSEQYSIELRSYDDQSSSEWTDVIARKLAASDVDIFLGGYSSTLTEPLAKVAHESGKLLLAPGAASTSVFSGRNKTFGTFPPTSKYLAQAVEGLAGVGAKTIATVWEDASFTRGVCGAAPDLSNTYGLTLTSAQQVINTPDVTVLEPVAERLSQEDPDVVITCVYDCVPWMKAMRNVNWSPKAQVFTVCVGLHEFPEQVGTDSHFIMGVTPWDASLNITDSVTGLSAQDFAAMFQKETSDVDVTYHAASAASVISILAQALEAIDAIDEVLLSEYIASNTFKTIYGEVSFDSNGQSQAPSLLIQYDSSGTVHTVFPQKASSGPIIYPMPSWNRRDCISHSRCETNGNTCTEEGGCVCNQPDFYYSVGAGESAECIPKEEMNFINSGLLGVGYFFVAAVLALAIMALIWVYFHSKNLLVRVSQPLFLRLICVGSIISTLSIIPLGAETGYRDSEDINVVDAACMAVPWLWGIGFAVTFSALFAKVLKVKMVYKAAANMRRRKIENKDVIYIMVFVLVIETIILLSFQLISPLKWEREVLRDINQHTTESVGHCDSKHGWWFFGSLVGFNVLCLLYALILCFQTKHIPSDFSESSHIFLSVMLMFQVLVLTVPVSAMVRDDTNVFYFMRAGAIFLQNFTVLCITFGPKMLRIYKGEDSRATIQGHLNSARSPYDMSSRKGSSYASSIDLDSKKPVSGRLDSTGSVASVEEGSSLKLNPAKKIALNTKSSQRDDDDEPNQPDQRRERRVSFGGV